MTNCTLLMLIAQVLSLLLWLPLTGAPTTVVSLMDATTTATWYSNDFDLRSAHDGGDDVILIITNGGYPKVVNHAVTLVGYGTDPAEGDFWLVHISSLSSKNKN